MNRKYQIDLFDDEIREKHEKELLTYLENNSFTFEDNQNRIIKIVKENNNITPFIKEIILNQLEPLLKNIDQAGLPPFLLEMNLKKLHTKELTPKMIFKIRGCAGVVKEDEKTFLYHRSLNTDDDCFLTDINLTKYQQISFDIAHELGHLSSADFFKRTNLQLEEFFTQIINIPYEQILYGYSTECMLLFPSYCLLTDKEKKLINHVYYGGKKELIENKPYIKRFAYLIDHIQEIDPIDAIKQIIGEENYQDNYDIDKIPYKFLEEKFLHYFFPEKICSSEYLICNLLNLLMQSKRYYIQALRPNPNTKYKFTKTSILNLNNYEKQDCEYSSQEITWEKIFYLMNDYNEIMSKKQKTTKEIAELRNLRKKFQITALPSLLISTVLTIASTLDQSNNLYHVIEFTYTVLLTVITGGLLYLNNTISEITKDLESTTKDLKNIEDADIAQLFEIYWNKIIINEEKNYREFIYLRKKKLEKIRKAFQATHEYDEHHHIKQKRLDHNH